MEEENETNDSLSLPLPLPTSSCSSKNLPHSFNQLLEYQLSLNEMLDQENSRFSEFTQPLEIENLINQSTHYLTKMNNVKKDMEFVTEKAERIRKRGLKLQEIIQKQILEKEMRKDQQLQREKQLAPVIIGKSAKK
ncbi:biogenesis of lysosome-related organelles complex 1 subunit 6-like [Panonychus citri]|uniref:biogenesis of lysosome-related organelles complex 1 subunit 6-like n=1 Tax=Panonychus citri TaxID=50023 RepID=UPI00230710E0|nr:biogenesis of lysosome-related organelles complex 1 subunit 6-like [Panonychus citri]